MSENLKELISIGSIILSIAFIVVGLFRITEDPNSNGLFTFLVGLIGLIWRVSVLFTSRENEDE